MADDPFLRQLPADPRPHPVPFQAHERPDRTCRYGCVAPVPPAPSPAPRRTPASTPGGRPRSPTRSPHTSTAPPSPIATIVRRPVFRVAICGDHPEYPDHAHSPSRCTTVPLSAIGAVSTARFGPSDSMLTRRFAFNCVSQRQPQVADQPQVVHARIPTIEEHAFRREVALPGRQQHRDEVLVLGDPVVRLVVDAPVAGDQRFALASTAR